MDIEVRLLRPGARLPERKREGDLGFDVFAPERVALPSRMFRKVDLGFAAKFPPGWGAFMEVRSSQGFPGGLIATSRVIDRGYRGELHIVVYNAGDFAVYEAGDRIAQLVPIPEFVYGMRLAEGAWEPTERGEGGFGSTGAS